MLNLPYYSADNLSERAEITRAFVAKVNDATSDNDLVTAIIDALLEVDGAIAAIVDTVGSHTHV